jgi:hypothetical protein
MKLKNNKTDIFTMKNNKKETGSAMVIALLIMVLLLGFVSFSMLRTSSETIAATNDASESRTFEAANASLEVLTRNFQKIFDTKLNPDQSDLDRIKDQKPPDFENDYSFAQDAVKVKDTVKTVVGGGEFQGMNSLRDEWEVSSLATERNSGVQVELRRRYINDRIPIFQFGIFYDDDLEFHPGPRFDFGGRVHSNSHIFMKSASGLYFNSKVSAHKQIITDVMKGGSDVSANDDKVYIKNDSNQNVRLERTMGSSLKYGTGAVKTAAPIYPETKKNVNWLSTEKLKFGGNLLDEQSDLKLPLKINSSNNNTNLGYIELVKRGKAVGDIWNAGGGTATAPNIQPVVATTADDQITQKERYYNKSGIRISIADKKEQLPKCATATGTAVTGDCGIRLDGAKDGKGGNAPVGEARGYEPRPMGGSYQATRINGERFSVTNQFGVEKQVWIKIETVGYNAANVFETKDITEDILSLGVTERADSSLNVQNYGTNDSRSVIKLQRFSIDGGDFSGTSNYISAKSLGGKNRNYVVAANKDSDPVDNGSCTTAVSPPYSQSCYTENGKNYGDHRSHWKRARLDNSDSDDDIRIVPFPINMFDTREGLNYESTGNYAYSTVYGTNGEIPWAGVMSMVDIDVKNLRSFLAGDFNSDMPTGTPYATSSGSKLKSTDIPSANGWVFYISDRRGDYDFDGSYDMEDVFGVSGSSSDLVVKNSGNDGILQLGEDVNGDGTLNIDGISNGEAPSYRGAASYAKKELAAVSEHRFYRRGVRLINGETIPGKYDKDNSLNTLGFTVASENAVYVKGNYNATGVSNATGASTPENYLPQGGGTNSEKHIPASIVGDAIIILSNNWDDTKSFQYPFSLSSRTVTETTVRFAMMAGDTITTVYAEPHQGSGDARLGGGVHNFKRFLEDWNNARLNYAGSIINLYNSNNNNGTFKCCKVVYSPPTRNWVFDTSFNDPNRLPPGTPFFQEIKLTGFQRVN